MKLAVVSLLICASMVLTTAFPEPEALPDPEALPEPDADKPEPTTTPPAIETLPANVADLKRVARSSCTLNPNTWYRKGDRIYIFVTSRTYWFVAQKACVNAGGSLVSLRSSSEEAFVKRLTRNNYAWIGLSDAQQPGYWFWGDATRFRYTNWCSGEPDNKRSQPCVLMNLTSRRCWYDLTCRAKAPFVCARRVR